MSVLLRNGFTWRASSFFFDTFHHINTHKIIGQGGEASIELVYRMTSIQLTDLKFALQDQNVEKIDALMFQILSQPAAHRTNGMSNLSSWLPLQECLGRIHAAHDSYFPEIFEMQLLQNVNNAGLEIDMSYFTEGTLYDKILSSRKSLALLRFGLKAIDATMHLHALGLIHRDIKLENFMIQGFSVVMIDFGYTFFKNNEENFTDFYTRSGSRNYAAPERYYGKFSELSDVFSLGIVLYQILRNADPNLRKNGFFKILDQFCQDIGNNLIGKNDLLPGPGLDSRPGLISQMLQTVPSRRPLLSDVKRVWESIMCYHYSFVSVGPMWFSLARI